MSTKQLSRRQARWSKFLSRFNFVITYRPGKQGAKPDTLTRRSGDLPAGGEDERIAQQSQVVLKPHNLESQAMNPEQNPELHVFANDLTDDSTPDQEPTIQELFNKAYEEDPMPARTLLKLRNNERHSKEISLAEYKEINRALYYRSKKYVPDSYELKLRLCKDYHNAPIAGYTGKAKTLELLSRTYI